MEIKQNCVNFQEVFFQSEGQDFSYAFHLCAGWNAQIMAEGQAVIMGRRKPDTERMADSKGKSLGPHPSLSTLITFKRENV